MTDEQRKQIEDKANEYAGGKDYIGNKKYIEFKNGAQFGLSLSDNRVKELETGLYEIWKISMMQSNAYAKEIFVIANKLLTPTDNDKEQKG